MPIGIQLLQHTDIDTDTVYKYQSLVWVDDIDPVWITVASKGSLHSTWHRSLSRTVMIPSGIYTDRDHCLVQ